MKISIGMLAYNEEKTIKSTVQHILKQDIFKRSEFDKVQFLIVANGCTDRTVMVVQEVINNSEINSTVSLQNIRVDKIETAGKSNAWNIYVHELSWQDADYLILIDADIELSDEGSLTRLVEQLIDIPEAAVSIDIPRKDIEKKHKINALEKISLLLSKVDSQKRKAISGQLYCIKGDDARQIYIPIGLPVEDGFLAAMIETDNFTRVEGLSRITVAESVSHYFQALVSPIELFRHEKRLMIGSTINSMIYNHLWTNVTDKNKHAGILIRDLNVTEPNWLAVLIEQYKENRGFWFVPKALCLKHLRNWKNSALTLPRKLLRLPIVLVATLALIYLALDVNFFFRTKNGLGHW